MGNVTGLKEWCDNIDGDLHEQGDYLVCRSTPIMVKVITEFEEEEPVIIDTQWEDITLHEGANIEANGEVLEYEGQLVEGELDVGILEV